MSKPNDEPLHLARNKAAAILANVELLRALFDGADPARPLLEDADEATRRGALYSLASIDRALSVLVSALRSME